MMSKHSIKQLIEMNKRLFVSSLILLLCSCVALSLDNSLILIDDGQVTEETDRPAAEEMPNYEPFVPTNEWQTVKPGAQRYLRLE